MVVVSINQPMYLPWLGILERISRSDYFVLLDNVPYSKNYFYNRNRIKGANGWMWLTIPVHFDGKSGSLIKDIEINNRSNWRENHWKSIFYSYKKAPQFEKYRGLFEAFYSNEYRLLSDAANESMMLILRAFGIKTEIVKASDLGVNGAKEGLLINICRSLKADKYISGPDGKDYIDQRCWGGAGIEIEFQSFQHPIYPQCFGEFLPQMAAIDLLFNCGGEAGKKILTNYGGEKAELVLK